MDKENMTFLYNSICFKHRKKMKSCHPVIGDGMDEPGELYAK
jgi:hypothetical protein